MEPFCCMFTTALNSAGIIQLCADDIAIVFQSWFDFPIVYNIFELADLIAGLKLKPRKCVLVPLAAPLSPHLIEVLRDFMRARVPKWAEFNIAASAEYLGIWLGPGAACHYWLSQLQKLLARIGAIGQAHVSSTLALKAYNLKAVTTLTYPAQVLPPPPNISKIEKYAFTQLYKVPYNTLAHNQQYALQNYGIEQMTSIP
eukprot:12307321-Karenia_brevis.AAC.1